MLVLGTVFSVTLAAAGGMGPLAAGAATSEASSEVALAAPGRSPPGRADRGWDLVGEPAHSFSWRRVLG